MNCSNNRNTVTINGANKIIIATITSVFMMLK